MTTAFSCLPISIFGSTHIPIAILAFGYPPVRHPPSRESPAPQSPEQKGTDSVDAYDRKLRFEEKINVGATMMCSTPIITDANQFRGLVARSGSGGGRQSSIGHVCSSFVMILTLCFPPFSYQVSSRHFRTIRSQPCQPISHSIPPPKGKIDDEDHNNGRNTIALFITYSY